MSDFDWLKTKRKVDSLPGVYSQVLAQYRANHPTKVRTAQHGKQERIEVNLSDDIQLIVYQSPQDGVKAAWYVAFNNTTGAAYKRELV